MLLSRELMSAFRPIFYLTASFFRGNLSSRSVQEYPWRHLWVWEEKEEKGGWHLQWLWPRLLLFLFFNEFMACEKKGAGIVWKQHPLDRYFADSATLSEHLTIAKCPLSQTGNHQDDFLLSFLEFQRYWGSRLDLEGCGSVSKAGLNPKSRMLCPRQTAEWLWWLKRFISAVRSAAAVASKPAGISPGAEIIFCVSQFSLARNFFMQSLPCLTLRVVCSSTS